MNTSVPSVLMLSHHQYGRQSPLAAVTNEQNVPCDVYVIPSIWKLLVTIGLIKFISSVHVRYIKRYYNWSSSGINSNPQHKYNYTPKPPLFEIAALKLQAADRWRRVNAEKFYGNLRKIVMNSIDTTNSLATLLNGSKQFRKIRKGSN